jgi:outer membrane receptor protein involved in Fe transport
MTNKMKTPHQSASPYVKSVTRTTLGLAALYLVAAGLVSAQQAPSAETQPASATAEEVVKMSPFVVTSTTDEGYEATATLTGTRINTTFKDLAASISAVTPAMLQDLGVNNSQQLLMYTMGTEVNGPNGNYSSATFGTTYGFDSPDRSFLPAVRVRGLTTADNTRDLFLTSIPWDGFDTDRIEVDRGPNAMLFGSGSPAGIINQTTNQPNLLKNKTTLTAEYGRFGSSREQLDANLALVPDKLAIRLDLKNSEDRFMQQEAFIKDKRIFLAGTYNILKYTTIRGDMEYGSQESVKPEWRPPYDNGVTYWYQTGQPAYNPLTGQVTLGAPVTGPVSALNGDGSPNWNVLSGYNAWGPGWGHSAALVFDQPNQYGTSIYGLSGINAVGNVGPNGIAMQAMNIGANYEQYIHQNVPGGGTWQPLEISNPAIFDFYDHMLEGPNKPEGGRWYNQHIALEQRLPDGSGGIEVAYSREQVQSAYCNPLNWATYGISIDINKYLLDGSINPNFGRPYDNSDSWDSATLERRENKRATLFYTFDSKKYLSGWLGGILGKHTVTANYSDSSDFTDTCAGRGLITGPNWSTINPAAGAQPDLLGDGGYRGFTSMVYLGNAGSSPTSLNIRPVTVNLEPPSIIGAGVVPIHFYNSTTQQWQTSPVSVIGGSEFDKSAIDIPEWTGPDQKTEIVSHVVILHSDMLYDALLPTIGYRTDNFSSWSGESYIVSSDGFSTTKGPLPPVPTSTESQHSFNWGGVVRLPNVSWAPKLPFGIQPALFYNKADNFQPTAERYNIFGAPIAPQGGQTKEYGIMLSALNNKLSVRLTHYDTALTGSSVDLRDAIHTVVRDGIGNAWAGIISDLKTNGAVNPANAAGATAFETWYNGNSPFVQNIISTFDFNVPGAATGHPTSVSDVSRDGEIMQTSDTESTGLELEVTYNPTNNWRISASVDKAQVITTNTARDAVAWLADIQPILNGPAGQVWVNGTTRETWQQQAQNFVNTVTSKEYQDGESANPELRKWRFNLVTNYDFQTGKLKNVNVGGAIRWQSEILLGTAYKNDPVLGQIPDYGTLYWGPAETNCDAWVGYKLPNIIHGLVGWKVQLNLSNIGVGKKLIPAVANPDGSIGAYRIASPMTWTFRTEFTF